MATIYNSELTTNIVKSIKSSNARDNMPSQIAEKVVPVIDVNPMPKIYANIVKMATFTNGTTASLYTTPSDTREFYLTGCTISYQKDATSQATQIDLSVYPADFPNPTAVIRLAAITLTAKSDNMAVTFNPPIKLRQNSAVTINSDSGVANIVVKGSIFGYTKEQ